MKRKKKESIEDYSLIYYCRSTSTINQNEHEKDDTNLSSINNNDAKLNNHQETKLS